MFFESKLQSIVSIGTRMKILITDRIILDIWILDQFGANLCSTLVVLPCSVP